MIGIVVVTHGQLAAELVNAARQIVGDIPRIAAVSIGWADDMQAAREAIERALAEVGAEGALVLTDMFGGTPTNVMLPFLSERVEIVTGVNLPMLIKLASVRDEEPLSDAVSHAQEAGRKYINIASRVLSGK